MPERVVIVGAGQAGAQVAVSLRQLGFEGNLTLLGEEPHLPYQRPPLSKGYLSGEMALERTWLRSEGYYQKHGIDLRRGARASRILRPARAVMLEDGSRIDYDLLVLCTGTAARRLPVPGVNLPGVSYLRTLADSDAIKATIRKGVRAVIVGGGYIGLEVAASLTKLGGQVTVIESLGRVMNRVVAPPVSAFFATEHARHGVEVVTGAVVAKLEGTGRIERVVCSDGREFAADLAVIGIGAVPSDQLAREAGLEVDNGVVVDAFGRTSDPVIFAAGDVTNHPNALFARRLRLESVHNAMEQAKAVARAIAGQRQPYTDVPWFWSDQYDLKLQIAGVGDPDDELVIRGDPAVRAFSCLHLRGGRLVAIDCVNRGADFLAAKPLIREAASLDRTRAADLDTKLGT
jgi:3-phenylpropionate/trans-cinnamate dioxygenase ferredoxin reductase subunit